MKTTRFATITTALAIAGLAQPAHAQIPPSVEVRVPKPPTVAAGDAGGFLAYELHVTNLTPNAVRLERVEVVDGTGAAAGAQPLIVVDGAVAEGAEGGRILATVRDSMLVRDIHRPGPRIPPAERPVVSGGMRAVVYLWVPIDLSRPPTAVRHRIALRPLSGDSIAQVIEAAAVPVYATGPLLGPPLRGEWVAVNGPSNASGHRRLVLALNGSVASGQRFGIDFVQMGADGGTSTGDRTKNETFHAYGSDVLAVGDGVVVETKDGIPENVPGVNSRAVAIDLETISGNSVVIDLGGGRYAFYAHLIPGSLRVRVGDSVRRGDVIGLVGNSGNSTEPHLHFHVVDGIASGTSTLGAEGIPYALEQFELLGRCNFGSGSCERAAAPVRVRGGIPLQNQIVRFPD